MKKVEAEGGCGVIGIACAEKVAGRHLLPALCHMNNRGNGKGGGIAAVGLSPEAFGVDAHILSHDYLLAIAYIDMNCRAEVERDFIHPLFEIDHIRVMPHLNSLEGLDVRPPDAILYFVRLKAQAINEDQIVYENSYRLNHKFYVSTGEKRAFVLSHGKNMLVLKMVGYGDDVIRYYQLEDFKAHVWIGHHRYPTKGRVWHPGGAHPFVGLNEALVHNGDFANYFSISEYLAQRHIHPLFLTDTEVAALLFDLLHRTYRYPLEYVIEALAPTTERDFTLLSEPKQRVYQMLQATHMHGSPDGPWFFLIAQSLPGDHAPAYRLIGITDTSMLRPQVFALQQGEVPIGFAASEKQAIDATLKSLASEDDRFWGCADTYWNARGGSYTDGGAFAFTVTPKADGQADMVCTNKFGEPVRVPKKGPIIIPSLPDNLEGLTQLHDRLQDSRLLAIIRKKIDSVLDSMTREDGSKFAIIQAEQYASEGPESLALVIVEKVKKGCKRIIVYGCQGQRFIANGMGPNTQGIHIDVYGSSGDYLGSGLDGATVHVHEDGQDQLGQIMKSGTLVVHGSVGQTFMYGAKGGKAFVKGNTAGRPLVYIVGKPRVVINGTCLDYLAESCMAGDPLKGGGFVIVNGVYWDQRGNIHDMETPYPGSNLFSLASGGAIYIRDPAGRVQDDQLNGGEFDILTQQDWDVISPCLEENARYFDIPVDRLLNYKGKTLQPFEAYRKIRPARVRALQEEEAWVKSRD